MSSSLEEKVKVRTLNPAGLRHPKAYIAVTSGRPAFKVLVKGP